MSDALDALAKLHPRMARVVELRFFGGMTIEQAAEALDVATSTIEADWSFARAWLKRELASERGGGAKGVSPERDMPRDQQGRLLGEHCAGDDLLRSEVESVSRRSTFSPNATTSASKHSRKLSLRPAEPSETSRTRCR